MTMPGFLERLGDRLDPEVAGVVTDLAPLVAEWMRRTDDRPTLVHFDYRADNLLFGTRPGATPLTVVDWQTVGVGSGATDIAYLVSGSFPDRDARAVAEAAFVDDYHQRMAAAGVDLDRDDLWNDYRLGSLWGLIITVAASMAAQLTERGDDMFTAMAQRHGRQALDLDALALLR
jgi:aminoglycoside phosphotransferase (APT) family kinase protein